MRGWQAPLTYKQLRILNIYRRVPRNPSTQFEITYELRWRRILEEVRGEIARAAARSENEYRNAVDEFFEELDQVRRGDFLDTRGVHGLGFTEYRLTPTGNALLERWKKAGYP